MELTTTIMKFDIDNSIGTPIAIEALEEHGYVNVDSILDLRIILMRRLKSNKKFGSLTLKETKRLLKYEIKGVDFVLDVHNKIKES